QHGGGELALQAMNIFAQNICMSLVSVPCSGRGGYPAYGILHISGDNSDICPNDDAKIGISDYRTRLTI
ncbi:flavodoxin, partial [Clostridioides difficile]